ncbi:MAG: hypothetical protein DIU71_05195 [Proteobacteria bacterium]|nr:MAG: hypothetical protein DIU71_05195 [Pseudomonadota bacterium]
MTVANDFLVPLFGMIFSMGLPIAALIVWIVLRYRRHRQLLELHHAERMAAIERGMDVPPLPLELIDGRPRRRRSSLLPGLVWLFVGLAVLVSMRTIAEREALLGLIPMGVGLAYLIYYFAEGRKVELAGPYAGESGPGGPSSVRSPARVHDR